MVSIRFISFLFVLKFILQSSAADIHQVTEKIEVTAGNGFGGRSSSAIGKDIMGDVPTPREARNGKIGGRKVMKRRVLLKEMAKAKEMAIEGASKISGMDMNISKKLLGYPQKHIPDQETNKRMVTKISFNSARLKNLPNTSQIYCQHSKGDSIRFSLECSSRLKNLAPKVNDESRKLLEATKEIAHLMSKDYHAPSGGKPPTHD